MSSIARGARAIYIPDRPFYNLEPQNPTLWAVPNRRAVEFEDVNCERVGRVASPHAHDINTDQAGNQTRMLSYGVLCNESMVSGVQLWAP